MREYNGLEDGYLTEFFTRGAFQRQAEQLRLSQNAKQPTRLSQAQAELRAVLPQPQKQLQKQPQAQMRNPKADSRVSSIGHNE